MNPWNWTVQGALQYSTGTVGRELQFDHQVKSWQKFGWGFRNGKTLCPLEPLSSNDSSPAIPHEPAEFHGDGRKPQEKFTASYFDDNYHHKHKTTKGIVQQGQMNKRTKDKVTQKPSKVFCSLKSTYPSSCFCASSSCSHKRGICRDFIILWEHFLQNRFQQWFHCGNILCHCGSLCVGQRFCNQTIVIQQALI